MCLKLGCEARLMGNNLVYMQYMILTCQWAASQENWFENLDSDENVRGITIALLENIAISSKSKFYADLLARTRGKMIAEVLIVFLSTPDKEKDDAQDNPGEFLHLAIDVCDKQESQTVKSQAAKCLEAICSKVDGCVSFTSMFCIQAIDCYINGNHLEQENRMHYLILHEFYDKDFLSKNSEDVIIEACLSSLSIISHLLAPRKDVLFSLDSMLKRNLDQLTQGPMLVQARLALFYGYFTDILFKDDIEKFNQSIKFLFEAINYSESMIAVGYQACETLTTLIGDKNVIPKIGPLFEDICNLLVGYVETNRIPLFFNFMNEFVSIFKPSLKEKIIDFVRVFANRIKVEQESLEGTNEKTNHVINQSCNVVRTICEGKEYIEQFGEQIDQELMVLYNFMDQPEKIDFDDDIALCISTAININKKITDIQKQVFFAFDKVHSKYKGIFGNLVVSINSFIVYNDGWFAENPDAVKDLVSMATRGLYYGEPINGIYTPCDGAIVFQLCLQYFKSPTFDDYFADALSNTLEIMKKFKESENLKIVFLGTFLSAFIYSPEATLKYLDSEDIIEAIFEELFVNDSKMFHRYQKKLYLFGLGQMLFSEYLPDFISQNFAKILSKMILMLGRLNLAEKFDAKKKNFIKNDIDEDHPTRKENLRSQENTKTQENEEEDEEIIENELKGINDYYEAISSGSLLNTPVDNQNPPFVIHKVENNGDGGCCNHENDNHHNHDHEHDHNHDDDLNDSCCGELDEYDILDREYEEREELEMEYDLIKTKIRDMDENDYFRTVIFKLYKISPEQFSNIMSQLSPKQNEFLKSLLQTQTLHMKINGVETPVHRKILKAKRRR
ncbi:unnamed protein product [Moneuplotes crassus]|uniref:Uncharacterized protein n=1 Tax=Euplotes crassus TaxID=5936 RepID=A0AAD1XI82_EUPCR|nr:unnamed protein product [Moneuplotes crassus]